jgi:hypothetical protein
MKTNITNTYTVVPMIIRRVLKVTIDKKKELEQTEKTIHVPIEGETSILNINTTLGVPP